MRRWSAHVSAFVVTAAMLLAAAEPPATAGPTAETATIRASTTAVVAAARPKATVHAQAVKQVNGRILVSVHSNAKYVKLKYKTRNGRTATHKLRVRSGVVQRELAAGSRSIKVRTYATKRLRATSFRSVKITAAAAPDNPALRVVGNRLVDSAGRTVVLHGVNRSSSEYACIAGWGVYSGPTDQASIDAMKQWGINAVRVPLNSACWLGIRRQFTSYNAAYAGQAYQDAIAQFVDLLTANGIYPILELHWTGCGTAPCYANWLKPMPEREYATQFWGSVAQRFKSNQSVLFDLFNEPQSVDWGCWRDGGCLAFAGNPDVEFTVEGMQPMVNAVRGAGATTQPILLGGLAYANDMRGWLSHLPTDPSNSLVASVHLYNFNWPCPLTVANNRTAADAINCFSNPAFNPLDGIAASHPIVFGELGQDGCATDFVEPMLAWISQRGYSVLGWAWTTADCSSFPSMITDYSGTPTAFGAAFRRFFTTAGSL